jgi:phage terminase small subunit
MAEVRRKDRPRDEARRAAPACANRPITRPLSEQRLTERQEAFCQFYVEGHSGTAAAKHAGYAPGSAHVTASRLLRAPKVAARIAALRRDLGVANEISPKVVLAKLERLYRAAAYNRSFTAAARILTLQAQFAGIAPNVRGSGGTQSPPQRASEPPRDEVSSKLGANKAANAPANGRAQEDAKVDAKHLAKADAKPTGGNATEDAADSCGGTASDTASDTAALDAPARPVPENLARRYSEKRQRAAARNRRR